MIASTIYERSQSHHFWLLFSGDIDSELKRSKIAETGRQRMAHIVFIPPVSLQLAFGTACSIGNLLEIGHVQSSAHVTSFHSVKSLLHNIIDDKKAKVPIKGINMIMLTAGERLHLVIIGVSMVIDSRKAPRSVASCPVTLPYFHPLVKTMS
ncbi:unnamed protein product, partial [Heterosigma akashiwo]